MLPHDPLRTPSKFGDRGRPLQPLQNRYRSVSPCVSPKSDRGFTLSQRLERVGGWRCQRRGRPRCGGAAVALAAVRRAAAQHVRAQGDMETIDRPVDIRKSFKVNGMWAEEILARRKTIETSGQACTKKGEAPGWVLLNDKSKRGRNDPPLAGSAAGAALLGARLEYTTKEEFEADFEKHRVPAGHPEYGFEVRKRTYGYPVLDVIRFPERVSFRNLTSGQNRWKECQPVAVPMSQT